MICVYSGQITSITLKYQLFIEKLHFTDYGPSGPLNDLYDAVFLFRFYIMFLYVLIASHYMICMTK